MTSRRHLAQPSLVLDISPRAGMAYRSFLRRYVPRAHALMRTHIVELSIALVGSAAMSRLHRRFLGIDGPTDVITFELERNSRGAVTSGEIVICVPFALGQARKVGTDPAHELLLYAVHGLLHLSGYDDLTKAGFRAMHREEDRILTALRIGPVFEPDDGTDKTASTRRHKKDVAR